MCKVYAKPKMNREIHKASPGCEPHWPRLDRKSTRLNSSHSQISYAVFCVRKKTLPGSTSSLRKIRHRHQSLAGIRRAHAADRIPCLLHKSDNKSKYDPARATSFSPMCFAI